MSKGSFGKMKTVQFPSDFQNSKNRHVDPSTLPKFPSFPTHLQIPEAPIVPKHLYNDYIYIEVDDASPTITYKTKYTVTYTSINVHTKEETLITNLYNTYEEALSGHKSLELSTISCKNVSWITKEVIKYETLGKHWELVKRDEEGTKEETKEKS